MNNDTPKRVAKASYFTSYLATQPIYTPPVNKSLISGCLLMLNPYKKKPIEGFKNNKNII